MGIEPTELGFEGQPNQVWPRIALLFALAQPWVHCAIVGTTNPKNARDNIQTLNSCLSLQAIGAIREAFGRAESRSEEKWWGLT